jgi:hypothetical protein
MLPQFHRPQPATVISLIALFVALGGSSYAAVQLSKGQVKTKHIAKNAVTTKKVKDGSLRSKDFKAGELPPGTRMVSTEADEGAVIGTSCTNYGGGEITINVAGPGRVLVDATTTVTLNHTVGITDEVKVGISPTSTDCYDYQGAAIHRLPAALPTDYYYRVQLPSKRVFDVAKAGTYTYYLNGQMLYGQDPNDRFSWSRMTATFFPN